MAPETEVSKKAHKSFLFLAALWVFFVVLHVVVFVSQVQIGAQAHLEVALQVIIAAWVFKRCVEFKVAKL